MAGKRSCVGAVANDRAGGERTQLARPFKSALPHGTVCDIVGSSIAPAGAIFAACLRDDARTLGSHGAVGGHKLELAARMRFGLLEDSFAA